MYVPSGRFENARYSEIYGYDPNATKGDLRRQGRQFRRYLKTDAADFDRALYEAGEQARINENMVAQSDALARDLADRTRTPMETKPTMTEEEILAQEAEMNAHREELRMRDLEARIAGSTRFGDAFRLARQSGLDTFKWRGRLYNTKLASEVNSGAGRRPAAPSTPSTPTTPARPTAPTAPTAPAAPAPAPAPAPTTPATPAAPAAPSGGAWREVTPRFDFSGFGNKYGLKTETINGKKYLRYDPDGMGDFYISESGSVHMAPTTGVVSAALSSYKDTPVGGAQRQNAQTLFNMINDYKSGKTNRYEQWEANYIATHPKPARNASLAGSSAQTKWNQDFAAAKRAAGFRQGGLIPRVNYFQ